jgi:tripartite-type tricarboxylate transporter receptor subunit TctC
MNQRSAMAKLVAAIVGAVSIAIAPFAAHAQGGKPIRLIVAFPPGGPTDFVGRVLATELSNQLGETVIVENKPGANGNIGADYVAKAPPDGSVLFLTTVGAVSISPALYETLPYDPIKDFAPISLVVNNSTVFVVNPKNPAANAAEFVANSLKAPAPVPIGSSGVGSIPHLTLELFASSSKANVAHIPYKGAAPVINDVIGSHVDGFFGDLPGLIGHLRSGQLKALAVAAPKRHPLLPDVKTLAEQGIAGVESNNWYALLAPAKTPKETVSKLNAAVHKALQTDDVRRSSSTLAPSPRPPRRSRSRLSCKPTAPSGPRSFATSTSNPSRCLRLAFL